MMTMTISYKLISTKCHFTLKSCNSHSIALSGCGWLTPFHFGVIKSLKSHGLITDKSIISGTSGGSLAALIACADIDTDIALEVLIEMSKRKDLFKDMDGCLKSTLISLLPNDVADRCDGRLHVTVTKVWPRPSINPKIVNRFESKEQLINYVAASCFIPIYSSRKLYTNVDYTYYVDGGVFAFMPPIGEIKVSPFPIRFLRPVYSGTPDITLSMREYSIPRLLRWSLIPPPQDKLKELYDKGITSANKFAENLK